MDNQLQEYDMDIRHHKRSSHVNADALSRRSCPDGCKYCCKTGKRNGGEMTVTRQVDIDSRIGGATKISERAEWKILK